MGEQPLRLLLLTPFPPRLHGDHGGARVIAQLLARFPEPVRVAVLCLRHPSEQPADPEVLERVDLFEEVPRRGVTSMAGRALRAGRWRLGLLRGRPFWVSDLAVAAYGQRLAEVVRGFRPDVVQVEYAAMAQYLPALGDLAVPRVLVFHEAGTRLVDTGSPHPLLRRFSVLAWRRFERRSLATADAAVVFTERDRAVLAPSAGKTPIVCIPPGTDFVDRDLSSVASDGSVLFVGNFLHPPNRDAALRLVRSIFPAVRASHPRCVLYVVGAGPPPEIVEAAPPGVVVTGRVPDVVPYLERAAVVVAPVWRGGGMRVKVMEALAAGKAVVASPLAAEGLDVVDGEQLRLAQTDEEFAATVADLLDDADARHALAGRARSWASQNLSWAAPVGAYERLWAQVVATRQRAQASQPGPSPGSRSHTSAIHSP